MSLDLWQRDFDELRARRPTRWGAWVSPRVSIAPWIVAAIFGDVTVAFGRLMIKRGLLGAPAYARRSLLAIAWGRVVRGHLLASAGMLICLGAFLVLGAVRGAELVACSAGVGVAVWVAWLGLRRRKSEADDEASRLVGPKGLLAAVIWRGRASSNRDVRTAGDHRRAPRRQE